jgi:hypothetical protein
MIEDYRMAHQHALSGRCVFSARRSDRAASLCLLSRHLTWEPSTGAGAAIQA